MRMLMACCCLALSLGEVVAGEPTTNVRVGYVPGNVVPVPKMQIQGKRVPKVQLPKRTPYPLRSQEEREYLHGYAEGYVGMTGFLVLR